MLNFFKKKNKIKKSENQVVYLPPNDGDLKSYQQVAQEKLPYLIDFMTSHYDADGKLFQYAVKSIFRESDLYEHMWVQVYEFKSTFFIGKLANEPAILKYIKYGDEVKVARQDVEDWILQDFVVNAKVGGFSSQFIRDKANKNISN